MSDFSRAEDLEPNKPEPHFAMGNLYFNRKEYKRAVEFYDHALELDGSHAMARCRRGISHYYRKNYKQAYQDLQSAYRLDPEIPNIRKYVQMAMKKMDKPD
jgi:lipoprotein NlpI